jgi:hypothetical protein
MANTSGTGANPDYYQEVRGVTTTSARGDGPSGGRGRGEGGHAGGHRRQSRDVNNSSQPHQGYLQYENSSPGTRTLPTPITQRPTASQTIPPSITAGLNRLGAATNTDSSVDQDVPIPTGPSRSAPNSRAAPLVGISGYMNSGQIQTTVHSSGTYGFVGSSATPHQTHCTPNVPNAHAQDCTQKYPPIDPLLGFPGPPLYEVPQLPSSIQYPDHKIGDVVKHEYIRQCQNNPKWVSVDQAAGTWEYTSKDVMSMAEQARENRTTGKIPSDTGTSIGYGKVILTTVQSHGLSHICRTVTRASTMVRQESPRIPSSALSTSVSYTTMKQCSMSIL